jgi:hypothetical protein
LPSPTRSAENDCGPEHALGPASTAPRKDGAHGLWSRFAWQRHRRAHIARRSGACVSSDPTVGNYASAAPRLSKAFLLAVITRFIDRYGRSPDHRYRCRDTADAARTQADLVLGRVPSSISVRIGADFLLDESMHRLQALKALGHDAAGSSLPNSAANRG